MNDAGVRFWSWLRQELEPLASALRADCAPGENASLTTGAGALASMTCELAARLSVVAPGVSPILSVARDGACVLTFTAGGEAERFDLAYDLVEFAPSLPGWEFHALRAPNAPQRFEAAGLAFDLDTLRFYYRLTNDRAVVAVLCDGPALADYPTRRSYAAAIVAELLGEEDFARFVSDALLLDYETWLNATPGGRSAPLALISPTFRRIFRRPTGRRRSDAQPVRLRLVS
jgi:hypothetical protein